MKRKPTLALTLALLAAPLVASAQNNTTPTNQATGDVEVPNRFWEASVGGGQYMVALERISAISRHKYVLDGAVIVDEVTVDALGQALVRFYYLSPISDAMSGGEVAQAAAKIAERGRDLVDQAAGRAGTSVQNMVVKKFPETTHARSIEYRVMSEQELSAIYKSVRTAWERGKGRKFSQK